MKFFGAQNYKNRIANFTIFSLLHLLLPLTGDSVQLFFTIMKPVWGIDLGGTKIEGAVLEDRSSVQTLIRQRVPTERDKGYQHIIDNILGLIKEMEQKIGQSAPALGICTPGTLDPKTQTIKNSNTLCLNGQPFKRDLEHQLGIPIFMANDANCFATAEANLGIVKQELPNAEVVFGLILGTGVGGGLVINGKVRNGLHGIGGEWGHIFLDESGGPCYCGNVGCVENVISGTALEKFYLETAGEKKLLKQIMLDYETGTDPIATQTVERMIHFFGRGLSYIINILDPDAIVVGGGVGNIDLLYTAGVAEVEKYIFNKTLETPFFKPLLGDSAGVFGAALLVEEK